MSDSIVPDLFENVGVYDGYALSLEEVKSHVAAINNNMSDTGRRAAILRHADNWKIVNRERIANRLAPIPNWEEFCKETFAASRQEIDRQKDAYLATKDLPNHLTCRLKKSHKTVIAGWSEDRRLPALEEAWNTCPRTQYGHAMSARHLELTYRRMFGQPEVQEEEKNLSTAAKIVATIEGEQPSTGVSMSRQLERSLRTMKGWFRQALKEGDVKTMKLALQMGIREVDLLTGGCE